ncbi:right-handed parallel beta-helix repeat-containing protein [Candidatus Woesearchaeota archaeon]|nr:right-handed parallel beta-helix repeat-containing protein [Candidatus Woesearchaeota archaeon]
MKRKRGLDAIYVVLAVIALFTITFFLTQNDTLTGAAIVAPEFGINPTLEPQIPTPPPQQIRAEPQSENSLRVQANCASWPCSCGDDITSSINMTSDLLCASSGNVTALTLWKNHTTFDCKGRTITFDNPTTVTTYYGIVITNNATNITVQNCNFLGNDSYGGSGSSTSFNIDIPSTGVTNITFLNITSKNASYGIALNGAQNITIVNSTFNYNDAYNVYSINDAGNHSILNSRLTNSGYGIYLRGLFGGTAPNSGSVTIQNNVIGNNSYGLALYDVAKLNITNNQITQSLNEAIKFEYYQQGYITENVIDSNYIENNTIGVKIYASYGNFIRNNTINRNTQYGLYLRPCQTCVANGLMWNNTFTNNNLSNNTAPFHIDFVSTRVHEYQQEIDNSNTVDGKNLLYLFNKNHTVINQSNNTAFIYAVYLQNLTIANVSINSSYSKLKYGIYTDHIFNSHFSNISVMNAEVGIKLSHTNSTQIHFANISNTTIGAEIYYGYYNNFTNSTLYNNSYGLLLNQTVGNNISRNIFINNSIGSFYVIAASSDEYNHTFETNNIANNRNIYYYYQQNNIVLSASSNPGVIYIINSTNAQITNLVSNGEYYNAFILNSSNIYLRNFTITDPFIGILAANVTNLTIHDGIVNFNQSLSNTFMNDYDPWGISVSNSSGTNLTSIRVSRAENAIKLELSANSILENISINYSQIYLSSQAILIRANNITLRNISIQNTTYGIYVDGSEYRDIFINASTFQNTIGVNLQNGPQNVVVGNSTFNSSETCLSGSASISYNTFQNCSTGYSGSGNVTNNTFLFNGIALNGAPTTARDNNFTSNQQAVVLSSTNSYFTSNFYYNNTKSISIQANQARSHHLFEFERIYNSASALYDQGVASIGNIFFVQANKNNTFRNVLIVNSTLDLNMSNGVNGEWWNLINSSINNTKLDTGALHRNYVVWYIDVNVTDQNANPLQDVNVSIFLSNGTLDSNNQTNTAGLSRLSYTEYYHQNDISYVLTPQTIKVIKGNYSQNISIFNFRNQTYAQKNFTLRLVECGGNITTNFEFGADYNCQLHGFNITSNNITIDGKGYTLRGQRSGLGNGFNVENRTGVEFVNIRVQNFTNGFFLTRTNQSNVSNSFAFNNSKGIFLNESADNGIYHTDIYNNSEAQVIATSDLVATNNLINVTTNQVNFSVASQAILTYQWLASINVTIDGSTALPVIQGANVSALRNDSFAMDTSQLTGAGGVALLPISSFIQNSSGKNYITPHSINVSFSVNGNVSKNFTSINVTNTNNTVIDLELSLNCASPYTGKTITSDETLCPGTYTVKDMSIPTGVAALTITCQGTTFLAPTTADTALTIDSRDNLKLTGGCYFQNYARAIYATSSDNFIFNNLTFTNCKLDTGAGDTDGTCVEIVSSSGGVFENFTFTNSRMYAVGTNNLQLHKGTIEDNEKAGLVLASSTGVNVTNITFDDNTKALRLDGSFADILNASTFVHNSFSDSSINHVIWGIEGSGAPAASSIEIAFNRTFGAFSQGNTYDDYCNKGTDSDGDGYVDTGSADVYPYNGTISTKINAPITDYHPKYQTCVTEVQVGSTGSGGSGSSGASAGGGGAGGAASGSASSGASSGTSSSAGKSTVANAQEARDSLQEVNVVQERTSLDTTQVVFTIKNTGDKEIHLTPQIEQDIDDPFMIVTRKTLGGKDSFLHDATGISYAKNTISGDLLRATLLNPEQIVVKPGETVEKAIQVKEGIGIPKQLKIQFTTFDETVLEKEVSVTRESVSGSAIDVDTQNNVFDLYAVIFPADLSQKIIEKQNNGITGAAVTRIDPKTQNGYNVEVTIQKKHLDLKSNLPSGFNLAKYLIETNTQDQIILSEFYGPYILKKKEGFVFGQQFEYDPDRINGEYEIIATIYQEQTPLITNIFPVQLD